MKMNLLADSYFTLFLNINTLGSSEFIKYSSIFSQELAECSSLISTFIASVICHATKTQIVNRQESRKRKIQEKDYTTWTRS